jgi:hypothetical protein
VGEPGAGPDATHWQAWHLAYEDPGSSQSRRLDVVRAELASALDDAPIGQVRLLSLCAGDGRDVLGVLRDHPRRADVASTLVELDHGLAERARHTAALEGIAAVEVFEGDAGRTSNYAGDGVTFDVVLCCGVFGNIADADIRSTIAGLATMVSRGGAVLWTRHRRAPDITPSIREWFAQEGFEELSFIPIDGSFGTVGRVRLRAPMRPAPRPARLFCFAGDGRDARC